MNITNEEYQKFLHEYYPEFKDCCRLGQAFCNYFNITDPELFYCEDKSKTKSLIGSYLS